VRDQLGRSVITITLFRSSDFRRPEKLPDARLDVALGVMTASDLVWALEKLRFTRDRNALSTLRIDRGVRDYLVAALAPHPRPGMFSLTDAQIAESS
jgi:hypothetical protein